MKNADQTLPAQRTRFRRLVLLIAAGAIIIGSALVYRYFRYARPVGTGPAGATVPKAPFEKKWSDRPVVLLGLGDSITQGLGASPGHTFFQLLYKHPENEFSEMRAISLSEVLPDLKPLNLAISGTTSIECIDYQLPRLTPYSPETFGIVAITTGGNDVIHNYGRTPPREGAMYGARISEIDEWTKNFRNRLDTIADRVRSTFPGGCHIFIANIYDPTDGDGDIELAGLPAWPDGVQVVNAYNKVLVEFSQEDKDVSLIDIRSAFLGHGVHCTHFWHKSYCKNDPHYWYWDNLEDPNDRGYDAIRRLFLMEFARVLPSKL